MWNNLTFAQLQVAYETYKRNMSWWAWWRGEHELPCIVQLRDFFENNLEPKDKKLTDADKIQLIKIIAAISEVANWRMPNLQSLYTSLWHNECSHAMRDVLCTLVRSPQFSLEVLNALQTNSVPSASSPTQPIAPSEKALNFLRHASLTHLIPQQCVTPSYLRWCIIMGEDTGSLDHTVTQLLSRLLTVPAPQPFLMDSICSSVYPMVATRRYIEKANALQRLTLTEWEEIKKESDPLEAALLCAELKPYPQLNTPKIRTHLQGVRLTGELVQALLWCMSPDYENNISVIIKSKFPVELVKDLGVLKSLGVDAQYEGKFIAAKRLKESYNGNPIFAKLPNLTKDYCELIINAELNDNLVEALEMIPGNLLTPERCKELATKKAVWFPKFREGVEKLKDHPNELGKLLDDLIGSSHPEQFSIGSTALIQAKLLGQEGLKLLVTADKGQNGAHINAALRELEEAKLLSGEVLDALFKKLTPTSAMVVEERAAPRV